MLSGKHMNHSIRILDTTYTGRRIAKAVRQDLERACSALTAEGSPIEVAQRTGYHPVDAARIVRTIIWLYDLRPVQA